MYMHVHKRMAFTTAKLSELPLRNTLPLTCSHCSSSPSSVFKSPKHSFSLPIAFSSLKTTQPNKTPHSKSPQNPAKTPSSAPWLKKWPSLDPSTVPIDANSISSSNSKVKYLENKGQSAIERIVHRLRKLGLESDDDEEMSELYEDSLRDFGDEKLGDLLKRDWVRPDTMLVEEEKSDYGLLPWERDEVEVGEIGEDKESERKAKRVVKAPTLAELTIEESELKRLRRQGMVLRDKVNVPKAGLTHAVLEKIHDKWRKSELVRLKFHEELAHDMKTAHILVEVYTQLSD